MISEVMNWLMVGGATLVGGGISFLIFLPYKREAERLKNETTYANEWYKHYVEMKNESKERDVKIDELYADLKQLREENSKIAKEREILAIDNTRLKVLKCEKAGCPTRTPPTGF